MILFVYARYSGNKFPEEKLFYLYIYMMNVISI